MLLAKKIRSLLNGGGSAAGVRGLCEAINMLEAEMKAHRDEVEEIPRKRGEAALADDAEKELVALTAREDHLYAAIEVAQHRVAALRERLIELTASDRQVDFSKRREEIVAASVAAAAGIREVHEKFAKVIELRDAARADGFERDVNAIPLLPYIVNLADPAPALDPFELAMNHYRQRKPDAVAVRPAQQPSGPKFGSGSYGGDAFAVRHDRAPDSLSHPIVGVHGEPVMLPKPVVANKEPIAKAAPPPDPIPLRPLFNDEAIPGQKRVLILKPGFQTPDGRKCRTGDVIALAAEDAHKLVASGNHDFAEGDA